MVFGSRCRPWLGRGSEAGAPHGARARRGGRGLQEGIDATAAATPAPRPGRRAPLDLAYHPKGLPPAAALRAQPSPSQMADPECKTNLRAQRSFGQVTQLGSWLELMASAAGLAWRAPASCSQVASCAPSPTSCSASSSRRSPCVSRRTSSWSTSSHGRSRPSPCDPRRVTAGRASSARLPTSPSRRLDRRRRWVGC